MFHLHRKNLLVAFILFWVLVFIAMFIKDHFIRPFGGDVLVVIFLYYLLKGVTNLKVKTAALIVLIFSFFIETMQYFHLVKILGLQHNKLACIVIGTSFQWSDFVAYSLGILVVLWIEQRLD
jgi:uncharacterized membrane protein YoaK (UPF0700 family)